MNTDNRNINKILVPLDGSALSEAASVYAANLAVNQDIELILLHVSASEKHDIKETERDYLDRQITAINTIVEARTQPGTYKPKITAELVAGHPADEILSAIREKNIDLVVMATHGRSGISSLVMGSVANKIVRGSDAPVLLVKPGEDKGKDGNTNVAGRIIIPLDGSKLGESVLTSVQAFVHQFGDEQSEVTLFSVCEPPLVKSGYPLLLDGEKAAAMKAFKHALEAEEYLLALTGSMRSKGINAVPDTTGGDPAEKIIKQARDKKVNLIAMATHGRSGITRMAYGSVAEAVIHGANTPILLVRPH